jgi:glyoxylase-like metal-dependent hydrolase (beta-lactamase superfamily II)
MQITNLTDPQGMIYSSNVYLIHGDWNALEDVNCLVDVGNDPLVIEKIRKSPNGCGKKPIEQVVLTHSHFDHAALLPRIREAFKPVVYAASAFVGADVVLTDGQKLHCGDRELEVIFTPGHSDDSICLYCEADGTLFVGDTPVIIWSAEGSYEDRFALALERLCELDVRAIYFGHGNPVTVDAQTILAESLKNVLAARLREIAVGRNPDALGPEGSPQMIATCCYPSHAKT